jgi:heptosyltransferase-2
MPWQGQEAKRRTSMSGVMAGKALRGARALPNPEAVRAVLVRAANWVGDALLGTPALAAVRRAFPGAHLAVVARPSVREVFAGSPDVDEVIAAPARSLARAPGQGLALVRALRRRGFDLAVLLPNAFEAALLARLARIPHRVGYATDGRRPLLTVAVPRPRGLLERPQVEYYLGLTDALGWPRAGAVPRLPVGAAAEAEAEALLAGAEAGHRRVALNPGSSYGSAKRWPAERYAALADRLREREGAGIVLVGGPGDRAAARAVLAAMRGPALDLTGRTGLQGLGACLRRMACLVTNDTGGMHVAAAVGTPVVAIFGPTDPRATAPLGDGHRLVRHPVPCSPCLLRECPIDHRCMTGISVDRVAHEVQALLHTSLGSPIPV